MSERRTRHRACKFDLQGRLEEIKLRARIRDHGEDYSVPSSVCSKARQDLENVVPCQVNMWNNNSSTYSMNMNTALITTAVLLVMHPRIATNRGSPQEDTLKISSSVHLYACVYLMTHSIYFTEHDAAIKSLIFSVHVGPALYLLKP